MRNVVAARRVRATHVIQLQIVDAGASSAADIDAAFETISKGRPQGLLVL
jgi:hypothetical protein